MKKRLISLIVAVVMLFSMLCPAAYADDETVSFDTCTHEWETPLRSGYSITIPGSDVSFSVKTEQCKKCKWYKHVATIFIAEFTYYSPLNVDANGLVPTELATYWANVWYNNFGKNATATKFAAGGGSTSGGGVGRPKGYADDNGTPTVNPDGTYSGDFAMIYDGYWTPFASSTTQLRFNYISTYGNGSFSTSGDGNISAYAFYDTTNATKILGVRTAYYFKAPVTGFYDITVPSVTISASAKTYNGTLLTSFPIGGKCSLSVASGSNGMYSDTSSASSTGWYWSITNYNSGKYHLPYVTGTYTHSFYVTKGDYIECLYYSNITNNLSSSANVWYSISMDTAAPTIVCRSYVDSSDNKLTNQTNITINNDYSQTWNGNIYTDNSTNLTYIYPQYTTVNEKNETVTNISNTPIIYNNETKKYYTYDTVTNNYYYITYEQPATPTSSPSPSPAPTEAPSPSPSPTPDPDNPSVTPTPTPTPGGDTGDTTGILAVLVEIRDNMIQGFLDIKAAFVAGFAELSANFTLAIENLNLNITNIFNKKFPDQSTPETAPPSPSPSPSPSPAPLDPILPETQNLIIPKMNSNTFTDEHGTWIASGSSKYSDVFDFFRAFDRSTSEIWETNVSPSHLQIEIPDPENYYIDGYIMRISKFTNRYAKEWTLQGSDDGKTWDDLDTQKDQNLSDMEEHKYTLSLRKAYKYYRLNMSNYASSMCSISHFNLLGYDAKDVVTPTPAPTDPPSPSPAPDPGKPDNGDKTNNFWTIIFPNGGGSEDGKKGIFWALVSLILALIAFFANLAVGVGYLFPFLPDGVVMTINTCLIVIFLFTIIKFIMRSK